MPEISRFFGIIIRMFVETGTQHNKPHLQAYYQDDAAIFYIDQVELAAGYLPTRQRHLVEAWIELYQAELIENWRLIEAGEPVARIPALRRG